MLQRRVLGAQLLELMLREIADLEPFPRAALARQRGQLARQRANQGRFAGAIGTEEPDPRTGSQREIDAAQHRDPGMTGVQSFERQQDLRSMHRLAELEADGRSRAHGHDALETLQRLEPALRLAGLSGLGAKAIDKQLQVRDFALLLVVRRLLHLQGSRALAFELGVVPL